MATVVVVGLGPAGPELLTQAATAAIERIPERYLRTTRHPSASVVGAAHSFDRLYEEAGTIEEVYAGIVDALAEAAGAAGEVRYAVPGSPLVAERSVELLLADERVDVALVPGLSFLDLAWARLQVDPVEAGVRVVDGHRFAVEAAEERGPLLVAQCDAKQVLSGIKLAVDGRGPDEVVVLQRLGLPEEDVRTVTWAELDREIEPDHLTSLYLPRGAPPVAQEVARFAQLVRTLRERCPWDREQTHQTLTRHLREETYEVLEAIETLPAAMDHLEEELGDLLFQIVFHATLASEEGAFTLADVARGIHDKLVHRHPHVFGTVEAETPGQVMHNWEQIKRDEKGRASIMDGIPRDLPSLLYAHKVQRKAASAGVEVAPIGEAGDADTVGELLFGVVALARQLGVDPEAALRGTTARFRNQFMDLEKKETADG